MILETLMGSGLGGLFRLVPEVLKFMDAKNDRAHEVTMFNLQLQADHQKSADQLAVIAANHAAEADTKDLDALIAATAAQGARTGVPFIDGLNSAVRPILTLYWCVGLYSAVLAARFLLLLKAHVAADTAILQLWGPNEIELVASMISFWFVDRALRRGGGVSVAH